MSWVRISLGAGHQPGINENLSSSKFGLAAEDADKIFKRLQELLFYLDDELVEAENAKEIWGL